MLSCVATAAMLASFFNLETLFKARPSPWLRAWESWWTRCSQTFHSWSEPPGTSRQPATQNISLVLSNIRVLGVWWCVCVVPWHTHTVTQPGPGLGRSRSRVTGLITRTSQASPRHQWTCPRSWSAAPSACPRAGDPHCPRQNIQMRSWWHPRDQFPVVCYLALYSHHCLNSPGASPRTWWGTWWSWWGRAPRSSCPPGSPQ